MSNICGLDVTNKKDATVVVATRILAPKTSQLVPFYTIAQLRDALNAERNNVIKLEGVIPDDAKAQLGIKTPQETKEDKQKEVKRQEKEQNAQPSTPNKVEEKEIEVDTANVKEVEKISRDAVIDFTVKEMKDYLKEHKIEIEGSSKMKSRDLTNALLLQLGYAPLTEDEVDR